MKRLLVIVASLALLVPLLTAFPAPQRAEAANAALFDPGNIISDANMYDGGAMTSGQVQSFLEQRVPSCSAGYTCLRDYRQNTPTIAASTLCRGGYVGATGERASDIIAKVGVACNISQRVLLVLLQKEQGLVTHCPARQPGPVRLARRGSAARTPRPATRRSPGVRLPGVLRGARDSSATRPEPEQSCGLSGWPGSPTASCSTRIGACGRARSVYMAEDQATAGLYIYTPYTAQRRRRSANLYGERVTGARVPTATATSGGCYTDWFGNPAIGSSLLRSADNATVYLVSGDTKYPVPSMAILASLAPLGQVAFVWSSYLNALATGHTVGRSIRGPDGSMYFYDAGMKLPFASCDQAFDYGASCVSTDTYNCPSRRSRG